jgi:adenylosuccinate synthase
MRLVVIGAQWGDEGKGKVVDFLAEGAQMILRYSGGANAGHTVVVEGKTHKFHLIPSGILNPGRTVVLGIGMVVDLATLFEELGELSAQGIPWAGRVLLADRAHVVLPRYKEMDRIRDQERKVPLGTTGRGIGVTYALKAFREGIRVADLFDSRVWQTLEPEDRTFLEPYLEKVRPLMTDVSALMYENRSRNVLLEGAQGTLLDLDLGTYPFVSSGLSCAAGAAIGAGIGPHRLDRVIGVFKAYTTRVGNGPFPSRFTRERDGDLEERVRELGHEYGVTTGRPRRCGYLDLVALRYACRSNGVDSLAITKMDVLDGMPKLKVCTAYRLDGGTLDHFPASLQALDRSEPVLETLPGWKQPVKGCPSYEALPPQARSYIDFIERSCGVPVGIVSTGQNRKETIVRFNPWTPS